ncbi:hypothetical protein [Gallaecimonas xiamenensis]|uniref:Uncharacterized protein n=1 Tax=Gallaecimonas xiamenensis 3-C-1 TaxID=745411 RepID=K2JMI1_9GAMM|nr:hypothetical protein [Gallaecimonas xiamenensis]EKE75622.1 hypothetical protein B3C1_06068 [Gallaecimonas xiamenensis 3-C-1]
MDAVARYFAQRQAMLASHEADLGVLKQHDRRLIGDLAQGQLGELSNRTMAAEVLLSRVPDPQDAMVLIEARECLWPGELVRLHQELAQSALGRPLAWWLAACYPALALPQGEGGWQQARACWLRGKGPQGPWELWHKAKSGQELAAATLALWEQSQGADWQYWLTPLWQQAEEGQVVASINSLAPRVDEQTLVSLMGHSHLGRFLPWLGTLRQPELAEVVAENQLYLTGGHPRRLEGRQCWGQQLSGDWLKLAPVQLALKFRDRLWGLANKESRGAPWSLFGGRICLGN